AGGPGHRLHPVRRPPRPGAVRPDRGGPHRRRPHLRRRGRRRRSAGPRLLIRLFAPLKKQRRSPLGCSRKRAVRFSPFGILLSGMRTVFGMSGPPSWMEHYRHVYIAASQMMWLQSGRRIWRGTSWPEERRAAWTALEEELARPAEA